MNIEEMEEAIKDLDKLIETIRSSELMKFAIILNKMKEDQNNGNN